MAFSSDVFAQDLRERAGYGQLINAIDRQMIANGPTGIGQMGGYAIQTVSTVGGGAAFGALGYGVARVLPLLGAAGPAGWITAAAITVGIVLGGVIGYFVSKKAVESNRAQADAMRKAMENITRKSFKVLEDYAQTGQRPTALINELKNELLQGKYLTRCDENVIAFNETTLKKVAGWYSSEANIVNNAKFMILNAIACLPADDRPANLINAFQPIVPKLAAPVQNAARFTLGRLEMSAGRLEHSLREFRCISQDSDLSETAQAAIAGILKLHPHLNQQIGR